jgi:hypothetical protein
MLLAAMGFWLLPPLVVLVGALGADVGAVARPALVATGLSVLFWALISYGMKIPVTYGVLYPLGALMAIYIVLRSTWRGERRVEWRGRVYGARGGGNAP